MEIKRNESTLNRPKGNRIIDAPLVVADLPRFRKQLKEEKAWEKNDRNGITIFKTSSLAVVLIALKKDSHIVENTVDGFIMIQVIEGAARIAMPNNQVEVKKDQLVVLHPQIEHSIMATEDALLLLTNSSK